MGEYADLLDETTRKVMTQEAALAEELVRRVMEHTGLGPLDLMIVRSGTKLWVTRRDEGPDAEIA